MIQKQVVPIGHDAGACTPVSLFLPYSYGQNPSHAFSLGACKHAWMEQGLGRDHAFQCGGQRGMCRMIGVVGQPSVPPQLFLSFRELASQGRYLSADGPGHLDGWGTGWFVRDAQPCVRKAPGPVLDKKSGYIEALARMQSDHPQIALAHLRKASKGGMGAEDTHPFAADGWLFAHNGTVDDYERLPVRTHMPGGTTDSERLFLHLLEQMDGGVEQGVRRTVERARHLPYASLTFLLTNGRVLVAYREIGRPDGSTGKESKRYHTLYVSFQPELCVVCSEPLPFVGGRWEQLNDGDLLIVSQEATLLHRVNLREQLQPAIRS